MWKIPPVIKVYEALGCVADGRITVQDNVAHVRSSSGNKIYEVRYNPEKLTITSNDNGSYWRGYLGYPAIAFLIERGLLPLKKELLPALVDIPWKDLNTAFQDDYSKTLEEVHRLAAKRGYSPQDLENEIGFILQTVKKMKLAKLGNTRRPPQGY